MSFNGSKKNDDDDGPSLVVKVRGLPWSTTVDEIIKFFEGCNISHGREGVYIVMTKEGRPSGEAFIEMQTEEDMQQALKKDREYVGTRYIEVFSCKRSEMEWVVRRSGVSFDNTLDDGCVRLRGLPFGCSKEEIAQFFTGLEIVPNGITLPMDPRGRSTGEAFVQFKSKEIAEKALLKHKEKIGHRYIEIFRSSLNEIFPEGRRGGGGMGGFPPRPTPYDARDRFGGPNRFRGGGGSGPGGPCGLMPPGTGPNNLNRGGFRGGFADDMDDDDWSWRWGPRGGGGPMGPMGGPRGFNDFGPGDGFGGGFGGGNGVNFGGPPGPHVIHMRGLPFRATKQDIADFFRPVIPLSIDLNSKDKGLAEVEFRNHDDAVMAMNKDKSFMSHRYIELFLGKAGGGGGGGGPVGRGGGGSGGRDNGSRDGPLIPGSRFKR